MTVVSALRCRKRSCKGPKPRAGYRRLSCGMTSNEPGWQQAQRPPGTMDAFCPRRTLRDLGGRGAQQSGVACSVLTDQIKSLPPHPNPLPRRSRGRGCRSGRVGGRRQSLRLADTSAPRPGAADTVTFGPLKFTPASTGLNWHKPGQRPIDPDSLPRTVPGTAADHHGPQAAPAENLLRTIAWRPSRVRYLAPTSDVQRHMRAKSAQRNSRPKRSRALAR